MVEDLTFATTFEAGEISHVTPLPIHIPSLLQEVVQAVNTVEQRGGRAVQIRLSTVGMTPGAENRLADPCLSRVIYNLLSNAVRYSPAVGQHVDFIVTYSADTEPETCCSDAPVGIKRLRDPSLITIKSLKIDSNAFPDLKSSGSFTFMFRNSTVIPMDPTTVRKYFSVYYHFDSVATEETPVTAFVPLSIPLSPHFAPGPLSVSAQEDRESLSTLFDDVQGRMSPEQSLPTGDTSQASIYCSSGGGGNSFKDLKSVKGLGLGLYTAFSMVKLMGGHLECSAASPDEACFWFTVSLPPCVTAVPVSERPSPVVRVVAEPVVSEGGSISTDSACEVEKQVRVLIVDDSSMCQKVIVKSLKGLEFLTDVASNGWEACEKLQQTPCQFDAVLMDLRMPVMDGLEATRYCREVLKLCNLPIIAITAEIGAAIRDEAIKAGASHFLSKPAKAQEIISLLRSLDCGGAQGGPRGFMREKG